jgi:hypothetical protein
MPEKTVDEHAVDMVGPSSERLGALEQAMAGRGVSDEARKAFRSLNEVTMAMPGIGSQAADTMQALRVDNSKPLDYRREQEAETRGVALSTLKAHHAVGMKNVGVIEAELVRGLLPRPAADTGQRSLTQNELRMVVGEAKGQELVHKLVGLVGQRPELDAEILSSFGESMLKGQGVEDQIKNVKDAAVAKWLSRTDGTERQLANRKALAAFKTANAVGAVTAYHRAAHLHLTRDDSRQQPETPAERDARERRAQRRAR